MDLLETTTQLIVEWKCAAKTQALQVDRNEGLLNGVNQYITLYRYCQPENGSRSP